MKVESSTGQEDAQAPEEQAVWPVQECIAILGGVLGFWGGVGSMGTIFLLILMTQRFFCRRREDKKEVCIRMYTTKMKSVKNLDQNVLRF